MENLTIDSKSPEKKVDETPKVEKAPLDLTSQKERISALHDELVGIHKQHPRTEIYNMITYLHDLKNEIRKVESEKYLR